MDASSGADVNAFIDFVTRAGAIDADADAATKSGSSVLGTVGAPDPKPNPNFVFLDDEDDDEDDDATCACACACTCACACADEDDLSNEEVEPKIEDFTIAAVAGTDAGTDADAGAAAGAAAAELLDPLHLFASARSSVALLLHRHRAHR